MPLNLKQVKRNSRLDVSIIQSIREKVSKTIIGDYYRALKYPRFRAEKYLQKSMQAFKLEYDNYWSDITQNRSLTKMQKQFDEVLRDGYALVDDYLPSDELELIRREIFNVPNFVDGQYDGDMPFSISPSDGICGLSITNALALSYGKTVRNKELLSLARALYGEKVQLTASAVLNKFDINATDSSNIPHWDDWRVRLKAFIYLTDVDKDTAPTIYFKGSVHRVPWRFEKDFCSVFMAQEAVAGGSWWPVNNLGLEKISLEGKAGTLVVFDARGMHAGSPLIKDRRVMLMNMYTTHLDFTHRLF